MIAPIYIDLSGTINEFLLSTEETKALSRYVLDSIGTEYEKVWERLVFDNLHQTRDEYLNAMSVKLLDDYNLIFKLTDRESKLPLMEEDGASSFDIKKGFEKSTSPKKRFTENGGWYMSVPFRHATPKAVMEAAMYSSRMPNEIYKIAKTSTTPLRLDQLPKGFQPVKTSHVGYTHKAAIYEGLHRRNIGTGNENRGGYFTFRRISNNSEGNSWMHPGFKSLKLMERALDGSRIDYVTDKAIDEFLTKKFS